MKTQSDISNNFLTTKTMKKKTTKHFVACDVCGEICPADEKRTEVIAAGIFFGSVPTKKYPIRDYNVCFDCWFKSLGIKHVQL
ncbi:MAG: hypothetical protein ACFFDI_21450, partial [Promethearchaeota archaeon]